MRITLRRFTLFAIAHALLVATAGHAQRVDVQYAAGLKGPRSGRVFVVLSRIADREPRLVAGSYGATAPFFGAGVNNWKPGENAVVTADTLGDPVATLRQLPAGEYTVQAVLNVYTQVTRADGHTLWAHWDQWEGQHWNVSPGLVRESTKVRWDPKSTTPLRVTITWQHPTPWYDDSYAVNSVNTGPYQDVLLNELVPELEKRYRLNPEANSRFLTGGSTGGWESLALQIQRPDFFGGARCLYPDPVDVRRNQLVDNYADTNAFTPNSDTSPVPERYMMQTEEGQPQVTVRQMSQREAVLGTKARSGQQFDAFDVRYGPVGQDGYPRRLWDRRTGTIGPSMTGKLHTYVGDMDRHHLQLAVHLMEEDVAKLDGPTPNFTFEYGRPKKPHGWQPMTNAELVKTMEKYRQDRVVRP